MVRQRFYTALRQYIRNSTRGFTLIELITATIIALIVSGMALTTVTYNRKLYLEDQVRTSVNQDLRAAMDLVGTDIKQAGEQLVDTKMPVIQITPNTPTTGNSQLVIFRNVLPRGKELPVCTAITKGSNVNTIYVANSTASPSQCSNSTAAANLPDWQEYRCKQDGVDGCLVATPPTTPPNAETAQAYIYDGNGNGEFFNYDAESLTSPNFTIRRKAASPPWANNYTTNSYIYLIEERKYTLNNTTNILQVTINKSTDLIKTTTQQLVNNIASFQVNAELPTGSPTTFASPGSGDSWQDLKSVNVTITAKDPSYGQIKIAANKLTASSKFFPRNVVSR